MRNLTVEAYAIGQVEQKLSKSGKPFNVFSVIASEFGDDPQNQQNMTPGTPDTSNTFFIEVLVFNGLFERILPHIKKGTSLVIQGEYSDYIYTTKTGQSKIGRRLVANYISFAKASSNKSNNQQQAALQQAMQQPFAQQPTQVQQPFVAPQVQAQPQMSPQPQQQPFQQPAQMQAMPQQQPFQAPPQQFQSPAPAQMSVPQITPDDLPF